MATNFLSTKHSKADLRSPSLRGFRKGLAVGWLRIAILVGLDAGSIVLSWGLALTFGTKMFSPWTEDLAFLPIILAVVLGILAARGLYKSSDRRRDYFGLLKAISLANVILLLIAFLYAPAQYVSRSSFILFWLLSSTLICLARWGMDNLTQSLRRRGAVCYPAFLICELEHRDRHVQVIQGDNRYNILGITDPSALDKANREATFESLSRLGVVEVFVTWHAIQNRLHLCWYFQSAGMTLRILPSQPNVSFPKSELWVMGGVPCLTITSPMIVGSDFWIKRCLDFCSSSVAIALLLPVYVAIAVLIKLDSPGPIFFRQTRMGLHGRPFKVWKFRTMVTDAEALQAKLESQNKTKDGVLFKIEDDPRITRIGKILRSYSLDELPQLFNVLLGEMSLVGPRPLPMRDVERFQERHFIRQEVLPGITGLWQVSGRSNIDNFDDVMRLDVAYIENWSPLLDLRILLQTVGVVLFKKGAY